jgi:hypothetical protein
LYGYYITVDRGWSVCDTVENIQAIIIIETIIISREKSDEKIGRLEDNIVLHSKLVSALLASDLPDFLKTAENN